MDLKIIVGGGGLTGDFGTIFGGGGGGGSFVYLAAPEPATWAMMLVGFGGIGGALRMARRKTAAVA